MSKFNDANEKIAEGIAEGFKKIEDGVVTGYKQIENGVVTGFKKAEEKFSDTFLNEDGSVKNGNVAEKVVDGVNKITDKLVDTFLTRKDESVEDAKARMAQEEKALEEKVMAEATKWAEEQKARIDASREASKNAGKRN